MPLRESDLDFDRPPGGNAASSVTVYAELRPWLHSCCVEFSPGKLRAICGRRERNDPVAMRLGAEWHETTLLSAGRDRFRLITPVRLLRAAGAAVGDNIQLELRREPPRVAPTELPAALLAAFARRPGAGERFRALTPSLQRQFVKYVESVKSDEARARRSETVLDRTSDLRLPTSRAGQRSQDA